MEEIKLKYLKNINEVIVVSPYSDICYIILGLVDLVLGKNKLIQLCLSDSNICCLFQPLPLNNINRKN